MGLHRPGVVQSRPAGQLLDAARRRGGPPDGMAGTTDDELVAVGRRRVAHRSGRRVHRQEHRPGHVAGHIEGQAVGPLGLHPGEERAAVENGNSGGEDAPRRGDPGPERLPFVVGRQAHLDPQRTASRHGVHPRSGDDQATVRLEFLREPLQQRHRIDLCLRSQPDAAVERERNVGLVAPKPIHGYGCDR